VLAGPLTNLLFAVAIFAAFNLAYGRSSPRRDRGLRRTVARARGGPARWATGSSPSTAIGSRASPTFPTCRAVYPGRDRDGGGRARRARPSMTLPVKMARSSIADRFGNESRIGRSASRWKAPGRAGRAGRGGRSLASPEHGHHADDGDRHPADRGRRTLGQGDWAGRSRSPNIRASSSALGGLSFRRFAALISINLAFINLLPIPHARRRAPGFLRGGSGAPETAGPPQSGMGVPHRAGLRAGADAVRDASTTWLRCPFSAARRWEVARNRENWLVGSRGLTCLIGRAIGQRAAIAGSCGSGLPDASKSLPSPQSYGNCRADDGIEHGSQR
jgi:hypothetical protein